MAEDNEQLGGVIAFLIILVVAHVICWIASVVKAVIDRKATKQKRGATKLEPLLSETHKEEEEEGRARLSLMTEVNTNDDSTKFAMHKSNTQPNSPVGSSNANEHHFPKCPKRHLSAGSAKRIGPEELAIMLDSYDAHRKPKSLQINDPPPITSPTCLTVKGLTTA